MPVKLTPENLTLYFYRSSNNLKSEFASTLDVFTRAYSELDEHGELDTSSYAYEEAEELRQLWLSYFSQSIDNIVKNLVNSNNREEEFSSQQKQILAEDRLWIKKEEIREKHEREMDDKFRKLWAKYKGTKWEEVISFVLAPEAEYEGDPELVREEYETLDKLREEFIKEFGHTPEDELDLM